ncbi:MAG: ubiquinone/menaquinone biosynthesis methyltransferase [Maritimibacter sp.]|nr:ubiquinone/menaquinone biosynthesis methyltransferase [Maritimibacter sp.]
MERATKLEQMNTTFGARAVSQADRQSAVTDLFDRIAPRYDLMNDLMSFGTHRLWKRAVVARAAALAGDVPGPVVDLAGGTGDLALALRRRLPERQIVVADASAGMLDIARGRGGAALDYLQTPAEALPFEDGSVALVTLSFGLRNMTDPAAALAEVARVLAPGGHLVLLEFSKPAAWFAPLYGLHARHVIPRIGAAVARDRGAYTYLVESIERFPGRADVARAIAAAGLDLVAERAFVFGVARLQIGKKP